MNRGAAIRGFKRGHWSWIVTLALGMLAFSSQGYAEKREARLVLLDPGHSFGHPGATSVRGTPEVEYNDAMAALLAPRLIKAGFRVEITRGPGDERGLNERADLAAAHHAWLLLSIHHDSAQHQFLKHNSINGKSAYRATRPIRGYSLFVSRKNPNYADSLRVAQALGRRLLALGRAPTLHHAELIPGESRPLLDQRLGIYGFDDLRVAARASCPAVLLEVGVLVDEEDEAYVSALAHREAIADAIVQALTDVSDQ